METHVGSSIGRGPDVPRVCSPAVARQCLVLALHVLVSQHHDQTALRRSAVSANRTIFKTPRDIDASRIESIRGVTCFDWFLDGTSVSSN